LKSPNHPVNQSIVAIGGAKSMRKVSGGKIRAMIDDGGWECGIVFCAIFAIGLFALNTFPGDTPPGHRNPRFAKNYDIFFFSLPLQLLWIMA
jgi:hypothetical protein